MFGIEIRHRPIWNAWSADVVFRKGAQHIMGVELLCMTFAASRRGINRQKCYEACYFVFSGIWRRNQMKIGEKLAFFGSGGFRQTNSG